MTPDPTQGKPTLNPWDRELVVDARSRGRRGRRGDGLPAPGVRQTDRSACAPLGYGTDPDDAGPGTPFYGTVQPARRKEPHKVFLFAPWAGVVAFACAIFGSIGPWVLGYGWSNAIFGADVAAVALGIYASLGAWRGRGRPDIAGGALLLGVVGIALWFWVGRPAPLLTPT
jgi:hypothetical protein